MREISMVRARAGAAGLVCATAGAELNHSRSASVALRPDSRVILTTHLPELLPRFTSCEASDVPRVGDSKPGLKRWGKRKSVAGLVHGWPRGQYSTFVHAPSAAWLASTASTVHAAR